MGNKNFIASINVPFNLIADSILGLFYLLLVIIINIIMFNSYVSKLDITEDKMYFLGNVLFCVQKDEIINIEVKKWSINKFTKTIGISFLFFKDLVLIETTKDKQYYIRSSNAQNLKEDLVKWKNS